MNLAKSAPLSFDTERFHIRRYKPDDDQMLFEAARESIDHVYTFLPWCHPEYSIDDAREWIAHIAPEWNDGKGYSFCITKRDTGELLGGCGVSRVDEHPLVNLGYWTRASALGSGVATEATLGLAEYTFRHLGIMRVEIIMSVENEASRKVAENVGAIYEGRLRSRLYLHGKAHDALLYALVPTDINGTQSR